MLKIYDMFEQVGSRESQSPLIMHNYLQVATKALLDSGISRYLDESNPPPLAAETYDLKSEELSGEDAYFVVRSIDIPREAKRYYSLVKIDGTGQALMDTDIGLFSLSLEGEALAAIDSQGEAADDGLVRTVLALKDLQHAMGWDFD